MRLLSASLLLCVLFIIPAACLVRSPSAHLGRIGVSNGCQVRAFETSNSALVLKRTLHLRGGDDTDADEAEATDVAGDAEEEKSDDSAASDSDGEKEEEPGRVIPAIEDSSLADKIPEGSVIREWWSWRDRHLKHAIMLEIGMITCPRFMFLLAPLFDFCNREETLALSDLLRQDAFLSTGRDHALRVLLCVICPKAFLLPSLLKDPMGMAVFVFMLLHCVDDVMSLITSPGETLAHEVLHALGAAALLAIYEVLPADPLSAIYARRASFMLYLDWAALFYLLVSPCMRAFSFATLLFR